MTNENVEVVGRLMDRPAGLLEVGPSEGVRAEIESQTQLFAYKVVGWSRWRKQWNGHLKG